MRQVRFNEDSTEATRKELLLPFSISFTETCRAARQKGPTSLLHSEGGKGPKATEG
jgi:hypothetical protein